MIFDEDYRRSLKSLDTEEHIDLWFYRPIGYIWAKLAAKVGITPNAITIASIFLGIAAGITFYYNNLWINVCGMLLLIWANSFDSADGQLARMTHQYSPIGRILDGLSGDFWFITIYIAICLRSVHTVPMFIEHPALIWIIAVLAGASHVSQSAMADYYRQLHLYFLKGDEGSELDASGDIKAKIANEPRTGNFWKRLTMRSYLKYTLKQEDRSPSMQKLRTAIDKAYPDGQLPASLRLDFRKKSLPLMKYTNILSFNWRTIILFISLFVGMPWLYFIAEITIFNALMLYMTRRHESICREFTRRIDSGEYPK